MPMHDVSLGLVLSSHTSIGPTRYTASEHKCIAGLSHMVDKTRPIHHSILVYIHEFSISIHYDDTVASKKHLASSLGMYD